MLRTTDEVIGFLQQQTFKAKVRVDVHVYNIGFFICSVLLGQGFFILIGHCFF